MLVALFSRKTNDVSASFGLWDKQKLTLHSWMEGVLIKHCRYPAIHGPGWLAGPWSYDCARPAPPVGWPLQSNGSEACGLTASSGRTNQSHTLNVSKSPLLFAWRALILPKRFPLDLSIWWTPRMGCSRDILGWPESSVSLPLSCGVSMSRNEWIWTSPFHRGQEIPTRCRSVRAKKKKVIKNRRKKIINFDTLIDGNRNNPSNC